MSSGISSGPQRFRGSDVRSFGFAPWFVFGSGLIVLAALAAFPDAATVTLEIAFPVWAVILLLRVNDNLAAPILVFPIIYMIWLWVGSITLLPASNLPTTILDPIPSSQWLLYLLGIVSYIGAVLLMGRPRQNPNIMLGYRPQWERHRFFLLIGVATTITFLAWLGITIQEGIPLFSSNVEELRVQIPERHHMLFQIMISGGYFLLPLLFIYRWSMQPRRFVSTALWILSLLVFFILLSQGNRGTITPPLLTILVMRHLLVKPWRLTRVVPISLAALLLTGAAGYYRSLRYFGDSFADTQTKLGVPPIIQPFVGIYFSIRAPLATFRDITVMMPKIVPFQYGRLSFGCLLQLLPGRHPSSDFFFKGVLGHDFTGFGEPASILGTFYGDLGAVGILIGMAAVGVMMAWLYGSLLKETRLHWLLVYAYVLQKLISSMYGSLFEYIVEVLLPVTWFLTLKYFAHATPLQRTVKLGHRVPSKTTGLSVLPPNPGRPM